MPDYGHLLSTAFPEQPREPLRNGLKRVPLKPGKTPTRKPYSLPPVSKKRRSAGKVARLKILDSKGRTFEAANSCIRHDDKGRPIWPAGGDVKTTDAYDLMVRLFCEVSVIGGERVKFGTCWRCGEQTQVDLAHIVPRSNECCNLMILCTNKRGLESCHVWQEKNWEALREILEIKCKADRPHADFVRIIELRKKLFA